MIEETTQEVAPEATEAPAKKARTRKVYPGLTDNAIVTVLDRTKGGRSGSKRETRIASVPEVCSLSEFKALKLSVRDLARYVKSGAVSVTLEDGTAMVV